MGERNELSGKMLKCRTEYSGKMVRCDDNYLHARSSAMMQHPLGKSSGVMNEQVLE